MYYQNPYPTSMISHGQPLNILDFCNVSSTQTPQSESLYKTLEKALPPIFTRKVASEAIGGLISAKTLANLDSLGQGPSKKVKIGGKVGYERQDFIAWLKMRIRLYSIVLYYNDHFAKLHVKRLKELFTT